MVLNFFCDMDLSIVILNRIYWPFCTAHLTISHSTFVFLGNHCSRGHQNLLH